VEPPPDRLAGIAPADSEGARSLAVRKLPAPLHSSSEQAWLSLDLDRSSHPRVSSLPGRLLLCRTRKPKREHRVKSAPDDVDR